jgi:hypothetical protein
MFHVLLNVKYLAVLFLLGDSLIHITNYCSWLLSTDKEGTIIIFIAEYTPVTMATRVRRCQWRKPLRHN